MTDGTAGTDHLRKELLSEAKPGFADAVGNHKQPARETLFHLVETVAGDDLGGQQGPVLDVRRYRLLATNLHTTKIEHY